MRLMSLLFLVLLAACSSHDKAEEMAVQDTPVETVDLMADQAPPPEEAAMEEADTIPKMPVRQPYQQPALRSYYPVMRGYKVDKNVEVFPLDGWQPPMRAQ